MIPIEYSIGYEEWQKVKSLSNLLLHYGSSKIYSKWVARFKSKNLWPCKLNEAERIARRKTYLKLWRARNKEKTRAYDYKIVLHDVCTRSDCCMCLIATIHQKLIAWKLVSLP